MPSIARATKDFQQLARTPQRARWVRGVGAGVRAGLVLALVVCGLLAFCHGQPHLAAGEWAAAGLAAGLAWSARPAELCRLAWLLLSPHVARRRHASAASACAVSVRALARQKNCQAAIGMRQAELTRAATSVKIGNRLLPNVCISPRIVSQRPN